MDAIALRRLIVRHRHVAPMLSVLLASTNARVLITDLTGEVILHREAGGTPHDSAPAGGIERHPITIDGTPIGWVEGPRPAGAIASVISYAAAREADKRALANEALERYRELNLLYDLAEQIGATLEVDAVAKVAVGEAGRLQAGSQGFLFLRDGAGALRARPAGDPTLLAGDHTSNGLLGAILFGDAEIVNDVAADPRANEAEKAVSSLVAAPLRVRGQRIGVVGTASVAPVEYRAGDLKVITALAALAGPTIQQAIAYEEAVHERLTASHSQHSPTFGSRSGPGVGR